MQRPFEGSTQTTLAAQITKAAPNFPITAPAVSMPCLHAISSALEEDPSKRMGSAGFETFTDNPFFRPIDFEALERKEIEPVFVPSSEKTNFDATYDLEELLLEEAPLEARARRQKPREALKEDATEKEIKEEELHKMIEAQYTTFDYTKAAYDRLALSYNSFPPMLTPIFLDTTKVVIQIPRLRLLKMLARRLQRHKLLMNFQKLLSRALYLRTEKEPLRGLNRLHVQNHHRIVEIFHRFLTRKFLALNNLLKILARS